MMEGATGKDMGTKQVSGVSTRRYAFVIPVSTYGKLFGPAVRKQTEAITKTPIEVEYAVGDDNLLRRVTTVRVTSGKKISTEITFSDWGKPVRMLAPPAAQVGPAPGPVLLG
jgi:hypothetical protein